MGIMSLSHDVVSFVLPSAFFTPAHHKALSSIVRIVEVIQVLLTYGEWPYIGSYQRLVHLDAEDALLSLPHGQGEGQYQVVMGTFTPRLVGEVRCFGYLVAEVKEFLGQGLRLWQRRGD